MIRDKAWQLAYRSAYRLMRVYWHIRKPDTHGALVAVWVDGRILLVKTSYLTYWNLPGGYVKRGESGRQAALRELAEEVGVRGFTEAELTPVYDEKAEWEGKQDHVEIFAIDVDVAPRIQVDNREVIEARFFTPDDALKEPLFPPIARVIRARMETEAE